VDSARAHRAGKRGGGREHITLSEALVAAEERDVDLILLDDALTVLAQMSPEQARVVELKFFGGLSIEETAEVLGISTATVRRDWTVARTWLRRAMRKGLDP
jgi:RNA polymerase sigma factor (TIGR02999 family)